MRSNRFNFSIIDKKLKKVKSELPNEISMMSLKFFQKSFNKQGWDDISFNKWKERKKQGKRIGKTLIQSGALRRSIIIKSKSFNRIVIGSYLDYSSIHNDGYNGVQKVTSKTGKTFTRHMIIPKRQFMGNSAKLRRMQEDRILKMINTAFK